MKGFGLLCLFLLTGAAAASLLYLGHSSTNRGLNPGVSTGLIGINVDQTSIVKKRKLKVLVDPSSSDEDGVSGGPVHLEDYQPIDPVPSSKASIRPGPIQHGTPVGPYVPKPKPIASPPPGTLPKRDG